MSIYENNCEIKILREYLRIPSAHPNVDYEPIVTFLRQQALDLDLAFNVYYPANRSKPVIVLTWCGGLPHLPSVMLNSHMDVASVSPESWSYPPFAAEMDEEGNIFARGIQDAKSCGMQYLAAIRALKSGGVEPQRTVHITFMPDKEIGGREGMKSFVISSSFKKLNVGFCLDEGIASPIDVCPVFYAERNNFQTTLKFHGASGDPSLLPKHTAGEKFSFILNKANDFRKQEFDRLNSSQHLLLGDVTTINLTRVESGDRDGNLPPLIEANFDIRLAIKVDIQKFANQIRQWCDEAGGGIDVVFHERMTRNEVTNLDESNRFWLAFQETCEKINFKILPTIFPASSDMKFLREMGIPALGFAPMPWTPVRMHADDEFLHAETYLGGIEIYKELIPALMNAAAK